MIRKMEPNKALDLLRVTQKYAAKDLVKALETVLANAKQSGLDSEKIGFKKIEIDASIVMKRFHAGTRGRVKPFKRRMSHIKIVLSDDLFADIKTEVENEKLEKVEKKGEKNPIDSSSK